MSGFNPRIAQEEFPPYIFEAAMLRSAKDIESYTVQATDGSLGAPNDFYFDDEAWVIRHLVVGKNWTVWPRVLISPISVIGGEWAEKSLPLSLTRQQIKDSPDIDADRPVSRQQDMGYLGYYGYGAYWGGGGLWGSALYPDTLQAGPVPQSDIASFRRSFVRSAFAKREYSHSLPRTRDRWRHRARRGIADQRGVLGDSISDR